MSLSQRVYNKCINSECGILGTESCFVCFFKQFSADEIQIVKKLQSSEVIIIDGKTNVSSSSEM